MDEVRPLRRLHPRGRRADRELRVFSADGRSSHTFAGGYANDVELWAVQGGEPTFRPRGALARAWEGGRLDTLRPVLGEEFFKRGVWRRDLWAGPVPYAPATLTALSGERVFVGEMDRAQLDVRGPDGTLQTLIR